MRAIVLRAPRSIEVAAVEAPAAGVADAVVRLRTAGICGSDLAAFRGTSPLVSYPRILGHELVVDVVDGGPRPELTGCRAVVEPLLPCGRCRTCRAGRGNCCPSLRVLGVHVDGGMRQQFSVPAGCLYAIPEGMPDDVAALAEPATVAYRAVQRSGVEAGRVAIVFGAGPIGLLIAQLLVRARGCQTFVIDVDPARLEVARRLGAVPLDARAQDVAAGVAGATAGELADVVFEATGNADCTRQTANVVGHAGRIVLIGWNHGPVEFDTVTLMRKEAEVVGSRNSVGAFPPVLRLLAAGAIDAKVMVTHRFGFEEAPGALELLDRGAEGALKILIGAS